MNRVSKVILVLLGAILVLCAAGFIGVNLYIQSPGTQARIQRELSKTIQAPLQITSTTVTPWGSLHMSGITVPSNGDSLIEAKAFDASCRTWPLLHGHFVVRKMTLDSPRIVWAQDADGKWKLPALPESHEPKAGEAHSTKIKHPRVAVEKIQIRNGSIELVDRTKMRVANATAVEMNYRLREDGSVDGDIAADRISWRDTLNFSKVHSPLTLKDGSLQFTNVESSLAGGDVRGQITVNTEEKNPQFDANLTLTGVDLARLTTEANWEPGQSAGSLSGKLVLHGFTDHFEASQGRGSLSVTNGRFQQLQLLEMIGEVLQIPELADLRVNTGEADFQIADQQTTIDRLELNGSDVRLMAKGNSQWNGKLGLDAQLSITDRLAKKLPELILKHFAAADKEGRRSIAFNIGGRLDKPRTNLVDQVIGKEVTGQFQDLLGSIFGNFKKKKDKPRKEVPSAAPAPAATPAPEHGREP